MPDLLSPAEYKAAVGIDPTDTREDTKLATLIPWASMVISNYAERDFGSPVATETRNFPYDGSGFLDIDDAAAITKVEFLVPNGSNIVLTSDAWYAAPPRRDDAPVFYYIVIGQSGYGVSPAMGFTRNLDVLYAEGRYPSVTSTAVVTGTWGWPVVPGDVKLAAVWTIQDWLAKPKNEGLTSEAIEGFSRSWGSKIGGGGQALAIPNRARDLLYNYVKQQV